MAGGAPYGVLKRSARTGQVVGEATGLRQCDQVEGWQVRLLQPERLAQQAPRAVPVHGVPESARRDQAETRVAHRGVMHVDDQPLGKRLATALEGAIELGLVQDSVGAPETQVLSVGHGPPAGDAVRFSAIRARSRVSAVTALPTVLSSAPADSSMNFS